MALADVRAQADIFRIYSPDECGADGYPRAWNAFEADDLGIGVATVRNFGIKHLVRANADHRCERCGHPYQNGQHGNGEWSPCDGECEHQGPLRVTQPDGIVEIFGKDSAEAGSLVNYFGDGWRVEAQWRVLTVHHLDGNKANCKWWNLASLDQRCHLTIQGRVVMERAFIYEHSEWMKPHAAGFYAEKYLGETLTREQASARQDELLALERLA